MNCVLMRVLWDKSWFEPVDPSIPKSPENSRGDAAANFCSEDCRLSFFRLEPHINEEAVAIAVAAMRSGLDDVDYCLLTSEQIESIGCNIDSTVAGSTWIPEVNALHVDVCGINLPRLGDLTFLAIKTASVGRVRGKRLRKLLLAAIDAGQIDPDGLKPGLKKVLA